MELLEALFVLVLLILFGRFGAGRYEKWRGTVQGSQGSAEREHWRQFNSPTTREDDDE